MKAHVEDASPRRSRPKTQNALMMATFGIGILNGYDILVAALPLGRSSTKNIF